MSRAAEPVQVEASEVLEGLLQRLFDAAQEHDLAVFPGMPDAPGGSVAWTGEELDYLKLADRARIRMLYVRSHRYDPDEEVDLIARTTPWIDDYITEGDDGRLEGEHAWVYERLHDAISEWDEHTGQLAVVNATWVADGVAHCWDALTPWYGEMLAALEAEVHAARSADRQQARTKRTEEASRLHAMAEQIAKHERFLDVSNDAKRVFMAEQLYPEVEEDEAAIIAHRATLVYWWDIEPEQRAARAERARELYGAGESVKTVAGILKMSEAEVRKALGEMLQGRSRRSWTE